METDKLNEYKELFSKKVAKLWDNLGDDLKWAKEVTEVRLQMEFLEVKQDRLFKEYGKNVFLYGECTGLHVDNILREIELIEEELQKKYLQLEKIRANN
jgi:hypothetical protein